MEPSIFMTWIMMVALKVNIRRHSSSILFFPFLLTYLNWWFHKVNWLNYNTTQTNHYTFLVLYHLVLSWYYEIIWSKTKTSRWLIVWFSFKIIQYFMNDIEGCWWHPSSSPMSFAMNDYYVFILKSNLHFTTFFKEIELTSCLPWSIYKDIHSLLVFPCRIRRRGL